MKWYSLLIIFITVFCAVQGKAQHSWGAGYFSSFPINPGIQGYYEIPLKTETIYQGKKKNKQLKQISENSIRTQFMAYYNAENYLGLALIPQWIFRITNAKGYQLYFGPGMGYHRSFTDAVSYVLQPDGSFETKKINGQNNIIVTATVGVGTNPTIRKKKTGYYFEMGGSIRGPFNSAILPAVYIGFGAYKKIAKHEK